MESSNMFEVTCYKSNLSVLGLEENIAVCFNEHFVVILSGQFPLNLIQVITVQELREENETEWKLAEPPHIVILSLPWSPGTYICIHIFLHDCDSPFAVK